LPQYFLSMMRQKKGSLKKTRTARFWEGGEKGNDSKASEENVSAEGSPQLEWRNLGENQGVYGALRSAPNSATGMGLQGRGALEVKSRTTAFSPLRRWGVASIGERLNCRWSFWGRGKRVYPENTYVLPQVHLVQEVRNLKREGKKKRLTLWPLGVGITQV